MIPFLIVIRVLHILAATTFIGGAFFYYFLLRPALRAIPPAHAVIIGQRVSSVFTWVSWGALLILGVTGTIRLLTLASLLDLFSLSFYETGERRAIGLMALCWLVTVISSAIMTLLLRPVLAAKVAVGSDSDQTAMERRRAAQLASSAWLDHLQLVSLVSAVLAAVFGATALYGGLI